MTFNNIHKKIYKKFKIFKIYGILIFKNYHKICLIVNIKNIINLKIYFKKKFLFKYINKYNLLFIKLKSKLKKNIKMDLWFIKLL
ncbi:hypothetical protein ASU29_052 [Candidatus Nasuia deltocephalinicola]|uniref:Uncharacterized protein n=1 Tax=Candidatus Nasuia deltocephalincola TaxID=1160784 RepID=A0A0S2UP33_9PROT|nr:hypothetical protein ASU29_052 [Candidatus Nasuia deltocephalinicola]